MIQGQTSRFSDGIVVLRLAISVHLFGWVLWLIALVLPAIESPGFMGGPDETVTLPGWVCFAVTINPGAWFAVPAVFLPLMFLNVWTLLSPLFFSDGVGNGVPMPVVFCSFLCIPIALTTLILAKRLYAGFYLWTASLTLFFVAIALLYIRLRQCDRQSVA